MILLQPKPDAAFHGEMMSRVMEHVIANVTENQPGKHGRRKASKNQKKQTVEKKREWNAYARRHNEPPRIVGIIMMDAVNNVVQSFSQTRFRFVMEYVPVDEIFDQRPEQNAQQKQRCDRNERQLALPKRDVKHVADDRQVQNQRNRRMHPRKELHEIALEHPNRRSEEHTSELQSHSDLVCRLLLEKKK